ncbi:hypothetical protein, partial [Terribacillus saccharophilus]
ENIILDLDLKGKPKKEFYTLVSNKNFSTQLYIGEWDIYCEIGRINEYYNQEIEDYLYDEKRLYKQDLRGYVEDLMDLDIPEIEGYSIDKYEFYLNSIENKVYEDFRESSNFAKYEKSYETLVRNVNTLNYLVEEKIKRMLIPNYIWKRK